MDSHGSKGLTLSPVTYGQGGPLSQVRSEAVTVKAGLPPNVALFLKITAGAAVPTIATVIFNVLNFFVDNYRNPHLPELSDSTYDVAVGCAFAILGICLAYLDRSFRRFNSSVSSSVTSARDRPSFVNRPRRSARPTYQPIHISKMNGSNATIRLTTQCGSDIEMFSLQDALSRLG